MAQSPIIAGEAIPIRRRTARVSAYFRVAGDKLSRRNALKHHFCEMPFHWIIIDQSDVKVMVVPFVVATSSKIAFWTLF